MISFINYPNSTLLEGTFPSSFIECYGDSFLIIFNAVSRSKLVENEYLKIYEDSEITFKQKNEEFYKKFNKKFNGTKYPFPYIYFLEYLVANFNYYDASNKNFFKDDGLNEKAIIQKLNKTIAPKENNFSGLFNYYYYVYNEHDKIKEEFDKIIDKGQPFINFFYRFAIAFFRSKHLLQDSSNLDKIQLYNCIVLLIVNYLLEELNKFNNPREKRASFGGSNLSINNLLLNREHRLGGLPSLPLSPIEYVTSNNNYFNYFSPAGSSSKSDPDQNHRGLTGQSPLNPQYKETPRSTRAASDKKQPADSAGASQKILPFTKKEMWNNTMIQKPEQPAKSAGEPPKPTQSESDPKKRLQPNSPSSNNNNLVVIIIILLFYQKKEEKEEMLFIKLLNGLNRLKLLNRLNRL